ncbi:phosphoribosylamine--glycine ligase [Lactobacillus sp. LC28-10]|uniref:Phosphoribosylamine--glycine ligase n=1 Tax=Secundilactobacillus angelensis TaxID=2722706 RepID=A0ABX1L141_9LACO|nr:phosphoribosylamine--glycine ligase [Secundilactobacillus angelensis]MCH5463252.1 phosphoribosylamine--glycine ligase [Secundilactobacillus angelensis]NLR19180.1 phosphoribosylamine--glycine ligase [Secundilactobacillus angelensis]
MENWLVVGGGGREYVLAQTLAKAPSRQVYVAPGNVMMNKIPRVQTVPIDEMAFDELAEFASQHHVQCTVVGPEQPLSAGIVDYFESKDLLIFGPSKQAAQLESSKTFAKQMMQQSGVPTANYREFTDLAVALSYVHLQEPPLVIKADGLAAGKGVIIANSSTEAMAAVEQLATNGSKKLLVEEYLQGEEFSLFAMVNGTTFVTMPVAQDHKRLADGDQGPNTGGMGAYSPVPHIDDKVKEAAVNDIIKPILNGMAEAGTPFNGFLYAGLIKTDSGIKVIEFNVRMGDPETQVVLPQLESDLGDLILQLKQGRQPQAQWQQGEFYLGTVVASRDYPRAVVNGRQLPTITDADVAVSYAGVIEDNQHIVSHGGRVLMVTTKAADLKTAQTRVNSVLGATVDQNDYTFRHDIGFHAIGE